MAKGVEVNGKKLRVLFRYEGERIREPLNLEATPENIKYAENLVDSIKREQQLGRFELARWFPNSKRLAKNSVNHWLDTWLGIKKERTADPTHKGHVQKASYIRKAFGDRVMESIDQVEIETWLSRDMATLSSKTIKDAIAVFRSTYKLYKTRYPATQDPTEGVTIKLPDIDEPNPFTRAEIDLILNTPAYADRVQDLNLVKFSIWSGPRLSEVLALAWEDVIDLDKGLIKFNRSVVRGAYQVTKTKQSNRVHELLSPAKEALQAQYALTHHLKPVSVDVKQRDNRTMKEERVRFVFYNAYTKAPHTHDKSIREGFFFNHLKSADVEYRGINQCRHTYISQMLTIGMEKEWISKQVGTSVEMIKKHYGKWIEEDAPGMVNLAEKRLGLSL